MLTAGSFVFWFIPDVGDTLSVLFQFDYLLKVKGGDTALNGTPISELWSITCHMGSHSVTCHPTQVNTPRLNPSQIG